VQARAGEADGQSKAAVWIPAAAALLPFVAYYTMIGRLFWFGDDIDFVDRIGSFGLYHWMWEAYAENFVPLFKLVWGSLFYASGGSYTFLLGASWIVHALNVLLLGVLLRRCGFKWPGVAFAQLVFALSPANIETLCWSAQLASLLSVLFLLLALGSFAASPFGATAVVSSAASALCFSRGVLTGALLALASAWEGAKSGRLARWAALALAYLAPALAVAVAITVMVPYGNEGHMAGHATAAAQYALWYLCLNPAHSILGFESFGPRTVFLLGTIKLAVVLWAICKSQGRARGLLVLLALFDIGYSCLLGVGRYHTGLATTISSRYQYGSMIATLPAAGFVLSSALDRLTARWRQVVAVALLTAASAGLFLEWPAALGPFSDWRGTQARETILGLPGHEDDQVVPGFPGFPIARARQLAEKYHLH
jgi:hypothetical protein